MAIFTWENWPLWFVCAAMVVAAVIDGWKLKVPNWLTFPLILSGWLLGLLYGFGVLPAEGHGGFGAALLGTFLGFLLLLPVYAIGGMGAGDVKMQMGFGAWIGAFYGAADGSWIILWSFFLGVLIGGVIALVMIALRGNVRRNLGNVRDILRDWLTSGSIGEVAGKASERKPRMHLLPYGIPLCLGALAYLFYLHSF
jgi:prepilin peptidase CpaA